MAEPSTAEATTYELRGLSAADVPGYLALARATFGAGAHQAREARLRWLYEDNPYAEGLQDGLLVVTAEGLVVGCHHRLRLPWRHGDQRVVFPSFHNLMVAEDHRHGAGAMLVFGALEGQSHALLAGLTEAAEAIYARLRYPELGCVWHNHRLNPLGLLTAPLRRTRGALTLPAGPLRLRATAEPSPDDIGAALSLPRPEGLHVDWDEALFTWRFAHPRGPLTWLAVATDGQRPVARALLTRTTRKRVPICRLVELATASPEYLPPMIQAVEQLAGRLGAVGLLSVTNQAEAAAALDAAGWPRRREAPGARFFQRRGGNLPLPDHLWGAAWDFGLDAPDRQPRPSHSR